MDSKIFQKLSQYEHHHLLDELETASEYHLEWLNHVNHKLLFGHSTSNIDLSSHAHTTCQFGRWYLSIDDINIRSTDEFIELNTIHQRLHQLANLMIHKQDSGESPTETDYHQLIQHSGQMRRTITRFKDKLQHDMMTSGRLMAKLFESAAEGVVVISPEMQILEVNQSFCQITGYTDNEVMGSAPDTLYANADGDFYEELWLSVRQRGFWQGEIHNQRKGGEAFLESLSIYSIKDTADNIAHFLAIFADITKEKSNQDHLYKLAHFDSITGLPNRMLFQDRLTQEIAHARRHRVRAAILFLDLDDFKSLNDKYGRPLCDLLLEHLSKRLEALLRTTDSIGRFGGDEFMILIEITNEDDYKIVADKVVEAVAKPFNIEGKHIEATGSLGISLFPSHSSNAEELIRFADLAMYRTKISGKNGYQLYSPASET